MAFRCPLSRSMRFLLQLKRMSLTSKTLSSANPVPQKTTTRTPTTAESLLADLAQDPDSDRLDEFARIYEPVMRRYARQAQIRLHASLCESDQDDLVQEAFVAVRHALPQFRYERAKGKFRNYLSLTIRNLAFRFQRRSSIARPAAPESLAALPDDATIWRRNPADQETRDLMFSVWSIAYARVMARRGFSPNTLAIFRSHVLEGLPVEQVAEEFKTTANAVYQIKDRILRAVRGEINAARRSGGGLVDLHEELLRRASKSGLSALCSKKTSVVR